MLGASSAYQAVAGTISDEILPLAVHAQYRCIAPWHSGLAGKYHEAHTEYRSYPDMSSLSISDLTKLQTVKYVNLGSLAILAFDVCITFSEEVEEIFVRWTWFRPWDVIRVIFVISRYLPFAGVGMIAYGE
ncbi:uncharacterized protein HD556DRAFT_1435516 [Suillus plorans]|uniref:DUF6533 domain-containing protein n=1 Tax=Suillus plorans TaxID=116603 RepID=A0A9P7E351_9AGAM|nr:uncharacterized protein HD556DRAFT_1435516 [Suillus plorans]KAG1809787.1 hypothetical protein HD556DRAFT_1435516 [Suillus plorans]